MKHLLVMTLFVVGSIGCGGGQSTNPNVGPGINQRTGETILRKASFAMDCPEGEIQLTKLSRFSVGASGCGHRSIWVYAQGTGWVNNGNTESR